jgi:hypothetical protein
LQLAALGSGPTPRWEHWRIYAVRDPQPLVVPPLRGA